jgi:hypothetical protein
VPHGGDVVFSTDATERPEPRSPVSAARCTPRFIRSSRRWADSTS